MIATPIDIVSMSHTVVGVDKVAGEDDDDAGDELVLDEDEEVDDDVVGETRASPWGPRRSPVEAARLG